MTPCYTTCWDLITQRAEVFRYLPQDHGVAILIDVEADLVKDGAAARRPLEWHYYPVPAL